MANTYLACYVHCVFSTKERHQQITDDVRERLWAYAGGIARDNGMKALAVGGTADHLHVLLSLPACISQKRALPSWIAAEGFAIYSARSALRAGNPLVGFLGNTGLAAVLSEVIRGNAPATGPNPPGAEKVWTCARKAGEISAIPDRSAVRAIPPAERSGHIRTFPGLMLITVQCGKGWS